MKKNHLQLGFIALLALSPSGSSTLYNELSSLEKSVVDEGLAAYTLEPMIDPEGKVIRNIYVMTSSPFSTQAGFLTILNKLHINTKEEVIKRQMCQKEGESFDPALIRDSELSLRGLSLVRSLAVIVPVRSNNIKPGEVDLLVATKDLLSLRPTFTFKGSVGQQFLLTNFMLAIGEHNFLGYNKSIAAIYELQQGAHIAAIRYFDPRLLSSSWTLTIKPSVLWERDSLKFDGFLGDFKLEKPLLSETDRWGYGIDTSYGARSIIDFNGSKVRTFDIPTVNGIHSVEKKYRWRYGKGSLFGRYSFGRTNKKEVFFSYGLNIKRPSILKELNLDATKEEYFKKHVLPRNELESFVNLGFAYFQNRFLTLYDYDNYRLQETIRLGPCLSLANDFASTMLFSDHSFVRPELKLSMTQNLGNDAFAMAFASTYNRYDGDWTDNLYKYGLSVISPKLFGLGRAILEGRLSMVYDNRDNQQFTLGSDSGIRGVESRFYSGDKGFRANLEIRSVPLDIWIFHAGLALFYDVGAAFNQWHQANATHAIGFGLRVLAPQVSSVPFRIDLAFPIYGIGKDHHVMLPSFGTGQAF
jgi:hypothetical protein